MKKQPGETGGGGPGGQQDYVLGSVSGSLFPQDAPAPGSLSALFQTKPSRAAAPLFVPAPKPRPKEEVKEEGGAVKGPLGKNQRKKVARNKSASELKVEDRESSLQNADQDEQTPKTPKKSAKKRKPAEMEGGGGGEMGGAGGEVEDEKDRPSKRRRTNAERAKGRVEEKMKEKKTVFVGNLPVSCTKKRLEVVFRPQGRVDTVRFRSVVREDPAMSRKVAAIQRKVHPKKQSVNAYVVFMEEEGATKALERNGMEIEKGFFIRVDRVTKHPTHDHKRSVFVGNLPFEVEELPVRRHFEECGRVEAVRLVRDKDSGMGKGFGYVLYESADSVQLALGLDGVDLLGRKLRVKRSSEKAAAGKGAGRGAGKGPHTTKGTGKGPHTTKGTGKGPHTTKGTGKEGRGPGKGGFQGRAGQSPRSSKPPGKTPPPPGGPATTPSSFMGAQTDPTKKKNSSSKALKKKLKPRKRNQKIHI